MREQDAGGDVGRRVVGRRAPAPRGGARSALALPARAVAAVHVARADLGAPRAACRRRRRPRSRRAGRAGRRRRGRARRARAAAGREAVDRRRPRPAAGTAARPRTRRAVGAGERHPPGLRPVHAVRRARRPSARARRRAAPAAPRSAQAQFFAQARSSSRSEHVALERLDRSSRSSATSRSILSRRSSRRGGGGTTTAAGAAATTPAVRLVVLEVLGEPVAEALLLLARPARELGHEPAVDHARQHFLELVQAQNGCMRSVRCLSSPGVCSPRSIRTASTAWSASVDLAAPRRAGAGTWRCGSCGPRQPRVAAPELVQRVADDLLVVRHHRVAVGALVAGQPQRVEAQRIGVRRRALLFDQAAEHAALQSASRSIVTCFALYRYRKLLMYRHFGIASLCCISRGSSGSNPATRSRRAPE